MCWGGEKVNSRLGFSAVVNHRLPCSSFINKKSKNQIHKNEFYYYNFKFSFTG